MAAGTLALAGPGVMTRPATPGRGVAQTFESSRAKSDRDRTWAMWVEQIQAGKQEAMEHLFAASRGIVYGLALRILGEEAEAEDVTLDVYMQVWRKANAFDATRGTVLAWLVLLARSRAIDRLRWRRSRQGHEEQVAEGFDLPAEGGSPERSSELSQQRERILRAMQSLTPPERRAIEMAFFAGYSHAELAEKLGQPLGTVKTHIRQALLKLRRELAALASGRPG